jgi:hypothetical protein
VPVGHRAYDRRGGDISGVARLVLDRNRLAQPTRQPLGDQPRERVIWPAGRKADNQAQRAGRISLRLGEPGAERKQPGHGAAQQQSPRRHQASLPFIGCFNP